MINFKPAPQYIYSITIDGKMVGYTNKYEHKVMIDENKKIDYFGVYATPQEAYDGNTIHHSKQYWLDESHNWKLNKMEV